MEQDCQAALLELQDKESIRDCLSRYCRGIDRVDEGLLRSVYWEDALDTHGAYRGSARGFIDDAVPRLRAGGRGVHQVTNVLIELHGDQAAVESSFFALQSTASAPGRRVLLCGRYLDRFERRAREWRIAERTVVYDWIEDRPQIELAQDDAALFGKRQPTGRRSLEDPLYAFLDGVRTRR